MKVNQSHIDHLVLETQKGNTKAFGELYDIYFPQIYKYVYYKVSEEHVEDLVGTIFIKAWTKIKRYRKAAFPFSSWLFRIASNTVIDHYRTNKDFYELEERIADDNEALHPENMTEKNLNSQRVHRALRKITPKYREVILLRFMNNLSNKEAANILKTNENNVRTLQFRALKKLRIVLDEQEREALNKLGKKEEKNKSVRFLKRIFVRSSSGNID